MHKRHSNVRASYFTNRVINVWNTLPADRANFSSFAAFERTVLQIDLSTFLLCLCFFRVIISVTRGLIIQFNMFSCLCNYFIRVRIKMTMNVAAAGWQVTPCDPMWLVSSRSGVAGSKPLYSVY